MSDAGKVDAGAAAAADARAADKGGAAAAADAGKGAAADAGKAAVTDKAVAGSADKGANKSILEGDVADLKAGAKATEDGDNAAARAAAAQTWPDDWRTQMAGGNADVEKLLKRYASPATVATALKSLRTRLDSGEFRKPMPDNPTPDEIAAYRKDNGIPEKPESYELADGLQISDIDKPILDEFRKFAHDRNYTPSQVKDVTSWYFAAREQENEQMYANDLAYRQQNEDALRSELGQEFRPMINGLKSFIETTFGADVGNALLSARLGDGTLAGNNPGFLKPMIQLMREINPAATLTLPAGDRGGKGVDARIAELEATMAKDITAWQSDKNKAAQDEYKELLTAREKMAARAA